jgi:hypothetical protein
MREREEIRARIERLESLYDELDPPGSPLEDERETVVLHAIEELEWVLGERERAPSVGER